MSQIHYVPVPDSDTEIIEESTYLENTARGVKIKKARNRKEQPLQEAAGQASRSRSKSTRHAQLQQAALNLDEPDDMGEDSRSRSKSRRKAKLRSIEEPLQEPDNMEYPDAYEAIEEQRESYTEGIAEVTQPQVLVRTSILSFMVSLIRCRQR